MAATNADATKGVLMIHLHDYTIQLAFAVSAIAQRLTEAGHGERALAIINKEFDNGR